MKRRKPEEGKSKREQDLSLARRFRNERANKTVSPSEIGGPMLSPHIGQPNSVRPACRRQTPLSVGLERNLRSSIATHAARRQTQKSSQDDQPKTGKLGARNRRALIGLRLQQGRTAQGNGTKSGTLEISNCCRLVAGQS
ncbi:hypothetical protein MPH_02341 [Macrophomina phaseolina MS6]|uniref:Uncharacterized protein n=1 Tax=Macrophomina phaseolina (strain MS6) TaxID=1126212 RepID=K2S5N1_MACPH|nr:hypothetical protein MPH_02341 [Macrophomina phaseolina MS6]